MKRRYKLIPGSLTEIRNTYEEDEVEDKQQILHQLHSAIHLDVFSLSKTLTHRTNF